MVRTMFQGTVPLSVNHAVGAMVFILMVLIGAVRTQATTTLATTLSGTGSMTTAEQVNGTSDVETSAISCFTCNTTNMTDPCYGRQYANQSQHTKCNAEENCWTFRFDENDKFLNLTRACHPNSCSITHNKSKEATECFDTDMIKHCTQCCKGDMCNRHVNTNSNESTTLATTLSGTGSMTTAEQVSGTSDVKTSAPQISCFTCNTTSMTDPCYGGQSANQSELTKCNAGENCWTFRFDENDKFLNLTRVCHPDLCSTMHDESKGATECFDTDMIQHCTQCCKADLCNRHVNANANDDGNGLSGCLSGVVLSVVAVLGMMQQ